MEICNRYDCTGCMACLNACPTNAISVSADKKGFYYPLIDNEKCINCNKCKNTCPANKGAIASDKKPQVFACWQKNTEIRRESSSGGFFSAVAEYVLQLGGSVFGAAFNDSFVVEHTEITSVSELSRLRGSKYVQSNIKDIFSVVKKRLDDGKYVLFSGTPCQVAGLNAFLGKPYDKLITLDIVCHGVPSPKFFADYLEKEIKQKNSSNITNIRFRYKKPSWTKFSMKIDFSDRPSYIGSKFSDTYLVAFLYDFITRDCCHNCKYTSVNRTGDITIADFWGYVSQTRKNRNTEDGISLLLLNTDKGKEIFDRLKDSFVYIEKDISEAKSGNRCLSSPYKKNPKSDEFWNTYFEKGYEDAKNKYLYPRKPNKKHDLSVAVDNHSYLIPKMLRKAYDKFKTKSKEG